MQPTVIDLFCGCGGLSQGFRSGGFDIVAGFDNDVEALETFSANFPNARATNADLSKFQSAMLEGLGNIDVVLGGPPCQGFSIAGKRDRSDPRNQLTDVYFHFLESLRPKAVLIENVPNILSMANGEFREGIISNLQRLGYKVAVEKLNSADFGVPQRRKRVFFIAFLDADLWPIETDAFKSGDEVTCMEALDDLPTLSDTLGEAEQDYRTPVQNAYQKMMRLDSDIVVNHIAVDHKDKTKELISMVPDGGNYKDLPQEYWATRKVNIAWTRMNSKRPCFTIDAGHNHHFHYRENRVPTVRECARIQSFPDNFVFVGKRTSQYRQVGNAVPPLLAECLAKLINRKVG